MIKLFLLSFFIGAHVSMKYPELKQLNLDETLLATFKWSDGSQNNVQMFAPNPEALELCLYRGSFEEDQGSSILG